MFFHETGLFLDLVSGCPAIVPFAESQVLSPRRLQGNEQVEPAGDAVMDADLVLLVVQEQADDAGMPPGIVKTDLARTVG